MTIKQTFVAFDGKEFNTKEKCIKYEMSNKFIPVLKEVKKMCSEQGSCCTCAFWNPLRIGCLLTEGSPDYWDLESIGG